MKAIVCVDREWGIGKNNEMLFRLPADLKYFRERTLGKVIVMGGNTLLSFPGSKPLKGRVNIVLTDVYERDDCTVVKTLGELREELKKYDPDDIFILGGAMFYRTMIDYCSAALVTKADAVGGAAVFFSDLDSRPGWRMAREGEPFEDNGITIKFTEYLNENVKEF